MRRNLGRTKMTKNQKKLTKAGILLLILISLGIVCFFKNERNKKFQAQINYINNLRAKTDYLIKLENWGKNEK